MFISPPEFLVLGTSFFSPEKGIFSREIDVMFLFSSFYLLSVA